MTKSSPENHTMHVGVLTYDYDPPIGGLGVLAKTYVHSLRSLYPNVKFTVISPAKNADERGPWLATLRWRKTLGCPLFSIVMSFALPSLLRAKGIDTLHVHAGSGGIFLLRKPDCRLIVTSHHTYRQESAIVFDHFFFKRIWKRWMSFLEKRTYELADAVTCVSSDTRSELVEHYGIDPSKLFLVENPVPADSLEDYREISKNTNTILFVGRLEERKGIMLLLKAFHVLAKKFPDLQLRLVGRNLIGHALKDFLRSHAIEDRVTVLGHIHDPFRFREMAHASVLVVPSRLEGFGLVAAEGMMLGTCVVASNAPGLRSIIDDGKTGRTFESNNSEDLARVLEEVLKDVSVRASLELEGRKVALRRFDVSARSHELMSVFSGK